MQFTDCVNLIGASLSEPHSNVECGGSCAKNRDEKRDCNTLL